MYIILIYLIQKNNLIVKMKSIFTYSLGTMVLLSGFITTNVLAKEGTKDSDYYLESQKGAMLMHIRQQEPSIMILLYIKKTLG